MIKNLPTTITILLILTVLTVGIIGRRSNGFKFDVKVRDFLVDKTSKNMREVMETITNLANVDSI